MAADIGAQWSSIAIGYGTISVNNGGTLYHGTYMKYSDTIGTIFMTDVSTGKSYIWDCNGGSYTLNDLSIIAPDDVSLRLKNGKGSLQYYDNGVLLHHAIDPSNDYYSYLRLDSDGEIYSYTNNATSGYSAQKLVKKSLLDQAYKDILYTHNGWLGDYNSSYSDMNNVNINIIGNTIGGSYTNLPSDSDGWGTLYCFRNNGGIIQFYFGWNAGQLWYRTSHQDYGNWSSWVNINNIASNAQSALDKVVTLESKFNNLFSQSGNTLTINY